jgi:hypothetical protein
MMQRFAQFPNATPSYETDTEWDAISFTDTTTTR